MTLLLDQLEQLTLEERAALICGNWQALQVCVQQKDALASQAAKIPLNEADIPQVRRLSEATRYNLELASSLSKQVSELLAFQQRGTAVYDQRGRLPRRAAAVMRVTG